MDHIQHHSFTTSHINNINNMKCFVLLSALLCVAAAEVGYPRGGPIRTNSRFLDSVGTDAAGSNNGYSDARSEGYADSSSDFAGYPGGRAILPEDASGAIPGRAGIDYPIYDKVPITSFQCTDQQFPGYYADPEAQCQVFHVCERNNRKHSFLCPNGTIFNQQVLVCDWWNVAPDCSRAAEYYSINEQIVKEMEAADERIRQEKLRSQGGYDYTPANARAPSSQYGAPNGAASGTPSSQYGAPNGAASSRTPSSQYGAPNGNGNNFGEYPSAAGRAPSSQYGAPGSQNGAANSRGNSAAPSSQYGAPARGNSAAPSSQYGAPAQGNGNFGSASSQYDAPNSQYGAPARGNSAAPSSQYGAPARGNSAAPSSQYGAPAQGNGNFGSASSQNDAPSSQYGAPARGNSAAPSSQYGAPTRGNSAAPSSQYGAPAQGNGNFGSASSQYDAPNSQYGAPAQGNGNFGSQGSNSFSSPSSEYGAPSASSNSYLPPQ